MSLILGIPGILRLPSRISFPAARRCFPFDPLTPKGKMVRKLTLRTTLPFVYAMPPHPFYFLPVATSTVAFAMC